ncbi:MAG: hypothetical protein ACJ8G3_16605 [Burkholderiaceae bacterium]
MFKKKAAKRSSIANNQALLCWLAYSHYICPTTPALAEPPVTFDD